MQDAYGVYQNCEAEKYEEKSIVYGDKKVDLKGTNTGEQESGPRGPFGNVHTVGEKRFVY